MNTIDHLVGVLFGSNINAEAYLPLGVQKLNQFLNPLVVSSAWENPAVGSKGPNFLNAIGLYSTDLDLDTLKNQILHPVETQLGRIRQEDKFAPRTMDLDIIFWDGVILDRNIGRYPYILIPFIEVMGIINPGLFPFPILLGEKPVNLDGNIRRREDVLRAKISPGHPAEKMNGYIPVSIALLAKSINDSNDIAPGFSPDRIRNAT